MKVERRVGKIRLRSVRRRRRRVKGVLRLPRGRRRFREFCIEDGDIPRDGAGSNALRGSGGGGEPGEKEPSIAFRGGEKEGK
jgi:hypothetical protein